MCPFKLFYDLLYPMHIDKPYYRCGTTAFALKPASKSKRATFGGAMRVKMVELDSNSMTLTLL